MFYKSTSCLSGPSFYPAFMPENVSQPYHNCLTAWVPYQNPDRAPVRSPCD
jgi:hypothetical protein